MNIFDRDLVKAINSGRCFALIGSGPSINAGLPNWKELTKNFIQQFKDSLNPSDNRKLTNYLKNNEYPKAFSLLATRIPINDLMNYLRNQMESPDSDGEIYRIISNWPFSCYLTTNYDDLLKKYLPSFSCKLNSMEDFSLLRTDNSKLIFKIHGDYSVPNDIVLTEEQYHNILTSDEKEYWRKRIESVLLLVDIMILGHSLSDPNFNQHLQVAKKFSSEKKPIFFLSPDIDKKTINELFTKFNIRVITYKNSDGKHYDLVKVLKRYDYFIAKRNSRNIGLPEIEQTEVDLASSLFLFNKLRLSKESSTVLVNTYATSILKVLYLADKNELNRIQLEQELKERFHSISHVDKNCLEIALSQLHDQSYIDCRYEQVILTNFGKNQIIYAQENRKLIVEQFEISCRSFLQDKFESLSEGNIKQIIECLKNGIIVAFKHRGIAIVNNVMNDEPVDLSISFDILDTINNEASRLTSRDMMIAFADLMIEIILAPSKEMKDYFTLISQGYFSYFALGLDPQEAKHRLNIIKSKQIILDASVAISLLSKDSNNFNYANDLIEKTKQLGIKLGITNKLVDEVHSHARWAIDNFGGSNVHSPDLILAASGSVYYKQNLFIEGYTHWAINEGNPSLELYYQECFGDYSDKTLREAIVEKINQYGITVGDMDDFIAVEDKDFVGRDIIYFDKIKEKRKEYNTYHNDYQCIAESEIIVICQNTNSMFLSLSSVINRVTSENLAWRPESLYQLLSLFSEPTQSSDCFYSMLAEGFIAMGISVIDKESLSFIAHPFLRQSRLDIAKEKERYEEALGKNAVEEYEADYEKIPDYQKPFYSWQFKEKALRVEQEKRIAAEERAKKVEQVSELTRSERLEYERLKGKKIERVQRRQKEKRRRKSQK